MQAVQLQQITQHDIEKYFTFVPIMETKINRDLQFNEVMQLINHIGEEERHFNSLELEYRKLASHWLLFTFAAIGFVFTQQSNLPFSVWILVAALSLGAIIGIYILWVLDIKVYHELLHSAFSEGVKLEMLFPQFLPPIRIKMVNSQTGGDIIKRVVFFYYFSIFILMVIFNIAMFNYFNSQQYIAWIIFSVSILTSRYLYTSMQQKSNREIEKIVEKLNLISAEENAN